MAARKTSSKPAPNPKAVKMTQAQKDALASLINGTPSSELNKKTMTALVARSWAKENKRGFAITAAGKKAEANALVA